MRMCDAREVLLPAWNSLSQEEYKRAEESDGCVWIYTTDTFSLTSVEKRFVQARDSGRNQLCGKDKNYGKILYANESSLEVCNLRWIYWINIYYVQLLDESKDNLMMAYIQGRNM